jgi:hypothetical protein
MNITTTCTTCHGSGWLPAGSCSACHGTGRAPLLNGTCRHCGQPRPHGGTVTCCASECQEQEYRASQARNARPRRRTGGR